MAIGYCTGCTCDDSVKTISTPNFSACRTRLTGGICGILIACDSDINSIPFTYTHSNGNTFNLDLYNSDINTDKNLQIYLSEKINNGLPLSTNILNSNGEPTQFENNEPTYHYWCVDADMPERANEIKEANNCYPKRIINSTQKIVGNIIDVNTDNYLMMQDYQCLNNMRIWFVTTSGQFYGGNEGIKISITKFDYIIPRALKEVQKIAFEFEWECKVQPPRIDVSNGWSDLPNPGFY